MRVYKDLCLAVHPDKGGDAVDFQQLRSAYDAWVSSKASEPDRPVLSAGGETLGTSSAYGSIVALADTAGVNVADGEGVVALCADALAPTPATFRISKVAVLLTFSLGCSSSAVWPRFLAQVESCRKQWSVKHWSATLEESGSGTQHIHLMLQFIRQVDVPSTIFMFEGVKPNVRTSWSDYLGEPFARKSPQRSFDRGFFYVWADKAGAVRMPDGNICVAGDYAPV